MGRGTLRIYLGSAPGVGKTFAMLDEGRRRRARGTDVVVAYVETHGRRRTAEQVGDLEVVPRRTVEHRGTRFEEMDVDAVLARRPEVALVDELAHSNVPGCRNEKRWQDVDELLAAGIHVISTVNIQHLESMNDVVEAITGTRQHETVPDAFVRAAEQVELVDMTPEALRRRMAHGNIYPAERIDAALSNYFREGNLGALRELALLWLADEVEVALQRYREVHGIGRTWETRERVVVAMTGAPGGEQLIRRAARIASRRGADLLGLHVRPADGLAGPSAEGLVDQRGLLVGLGGQYHEMASADPARGLVQFARQHQATQLVLGSSRRSRLQELWRGSVVNMVLRDAGDIDVLVVSQPGDRNHDGDRRPGLPIVRRPVLALPGRRALWGWLVALAGPIVVTAALTQARDRAALPSDLLALLLVTVTAASLGGFAPAAAAAIVSSLLANWYFTDPVHTLTIAEAENVFALAVFVAVAAVVSYFVSTAAHQRGQAARARAEAETLTSLAGTVIASDDPLPVLAEQIRRAFGASAVTLASRAGDEWRIEATAGDDPPSQPQAGDQVVEAGKGRIVLRTRQPRAEDSTTLTTFVAPVALALEHRTLRSGIADAARLAEMNELRAALLAAVSHDLRTPLAAIKASASTLRATDVDWPADTRAELLATIEDGADRLTDLVDNLLGMSRIHAGAIDPVDGVVSLEAVIPEAVRSLGPRRVPVEIDVDERLPEVRADAGLLERAVANVVDNACKWSPPDRPVVVRADAHAGSVSVLVVDHGPGIPPEARAEVFEPFQRLGDRAEVAGTGLGLAVARGFVEAMGGEVRIEDTPGGGATVVITLRGSS